MTYIEFFDQNVLRNIVACLAYRPERVVYIGDTYEEMSEHIKNCEAVFGSKGQNIDFDIKVTNLNSLKEILKTLDEIVNQYNDCVFDISGGDELLSFALGMIYTKYPNNNIQVQKYNVNENSFCDCDGDGEPAVIKSPFLSVDEYIRIFGGKVRRGGVESNATYEWDFNPTFEKDVNTIWNICKGEVQTWNAQIGVFEAIVKCGNSSQDGITVTAKKTVVKEYLKREKAKFVTIKEIICPLQRAGFITEYTDDGINVTIAFKDLQIKRCLTTAGLALELKTLLIARNATDENGNRVFEHSMNGVLIDWDGEFHNERKEGIYDTENEIDVFLMNDITPIFISCKNGVVYPEELYKLNTVANRFGGRFAKKVLIATALKEKGKDASSEYFRQRAKDMGIILIEKVQAMTNKKFTELLVSVLNSDEVQ